MDELHGGEFQSGGQLPDSSSKASSENETKPLTPEPINLENHDPFEPKRFVEDKELGKKLSEADLIIADYWKAKIAHDRASQIELGARIANHMVRTFATLNFSKLQLEYIQSFYSDWSKRLPRGDFEILRSGFLAELAAHHALAELNLDILYTQEVNDTREATDLFVDLGNLPSPRVEDNEALRSGSDFLRIQVKALPLANNSTLKVFYPIERSWKNDLIENKTHDRRGSSHHLEMAPRKVIELATEIFSLDQWDKSADFVDDIIARKAEFVNRTTVLVDTIANEPKMQAGVIILPSFTKMDLANPPYDRITGLPKRHPGKDNSDLAMKIYQELRKAFVVKEKTMIGR